MVRAIDVAKLFLAWAKENGDVITNLKLQKLLYYAQAWYLVNYRKTLFDDPIEAWDLGPVVRSLYSKWKAYGNSPIPYNITRNERKPFNRSQLNYLEEFYRVFSSFSATALVSMTHTEDPWKSAHKKGPSTVISTEDLREFYTRLYREKHGKQS
jgi:uncharacterized phage-associated protein